MILFIHNDKDKIIFTKDEDKSKVFVFAMFNIYKSCTYERENLKLNCQHAHPSAQFPCPSVKDNPSWINFSMSTLHRNVYKI